MREMLISWAVALADGGQPAPPGSPPTRMSLSLTCGEAQLTHRREICRYVATLVEKKTLKAKAAAGPWFSTQLILSLSIGLSSFLVFCFLRTRWEVVYMARTKLKGKA